MNRIRTYLVVICVTLATLSSHSASASTLCASGYLVSVQTGGIKMNDHQPRVYVRARDLNDPTKIWNFAFGLYKDELKYISNIATMTQVLNGALLAGFPVRIFSEKGDCTETSDDKVDIYVCTTKSECGERTGTPERR